MGYPLICMDTRRAVDAIKSRRIKSDKGDAWALAEMLRTGSFTSVHVKFVDTHRMKALLGARDRVAFDECAWRRIDHGARLHRCDRELGTVQKNARRDLSRADRETLAARQSR